MTIAALVLVLGGTPEEADQVWKRIGSLPVFPLPSQSIELVRNTLVEVRHAASSQVDKK